MVDGAFIKENRNKVFATVALLMTLACYSVSSSIGSGPDTDYHLANIWCGWGEAQGLCENQGRINGVPSAEVPFMFQMCNERTIESFPACEFETEHPESQFLRTQSGPDQNLYYKIMRVFASENPVTGVIQIRIFNSVIASLILLLILTLSTRRLRFAGLAAISFSSVPNVLQYTTSVNPRSWSILSVSTSWIFLYSYLESREDSRRVRRGRLVAFLFAAFLAFATRIDASIMVIVTSALVYLSCRFRPEQLKLRTSLTGLSLIILSYFALQFFPRILALFSIGIPQGYERLQYSIFQIIHIPEFVADWWGYRIGQQGNGPGIVGLIGVVLFFINLAFALVKSSKQQRFVTAGFAVIICALLFKSTAWTGSIVPLTGIYTLGMALPWLGLTVQHSSQNVQFMSSPGNRKTSILLLSFAHMIAFYSLIEFYTMQGKNVGFFETLTLNGTWWWNMPIGPNFVFLAGAILFPAFLALAWKSTDLRLPE